MGSNVNTVSCVDSDYDGSKIMDIMEVEQDTIEFYDHIIPKTPTYGFMSGRYDNESSDSDVDRLEAGSEKQQIQTTGTQNGSLDIFNKSDEEETKLLGNKRNMMESKTEERSRKIFKSSSSIESVYENLLTTTWMYGGFVLIKYDSNEIIIPPYSNGTQSSSCGIEQDQSQKSDNCCLDNDVCFTSCRKIYRSKLSLENDGLSLATIDFNDCTGNTHKCQNFKSHLFHIDNCTKDSENRVRNIDTELVQNWNVSCSVKSDVIKLPDGSNTRILQTRTVPVLEAIGEIVNKTGLPRLPICNPIQLLNIIDNTPPVSGEILPKFIIIFNPEMIWEQIIYNSSIRLVGTARDTFVTNTAEYNECNTECGNINTTTTATEDESYGYTLSLRHLKDYFTNALRDNLIGFELLNKSSRYYETTTRFITNSRFPKGYTHNDKQINHCDKDETNQLYMINSSDYKRLLFVIIRGIYNCNFRLPSRDICPVIAFRLHLRDKSLLSSLGIVIKEYIRKYLQYFNFDDNYVHDDISTLLHKLFSQTADNSSELDSVTLRSMVNNLLLLEDHKKKYSNFSKYEKNSDDTSVPEQKRDAVSLSVIDTNFNAATLGNTLAITDVSDNEYSQCDVRNNNTNTTKITNGSLEEYTEIALRRSLIGGETIKLEHEETALNERRMRLTKSREELDEQRKSIQQSTLAIMDELKNLSDKIADLKSTRELYDSLNKEVDNLALSHKPGLTHSTVYNEFMDSFRDNLTLQLPSTNQFSWSDSTTTTSMTNAYQNDNITNTLALHNRQPHQSNPQYNHKPQHQQQNSRQTIVDNNFILHNNQEYGNVSFVQHVGGIQQQQHHQIPFPFIISSDKCACGRMVFLPQSMNTDTTTTTDTTSDKKKSPVKRKPRTKKVPKTSVTDSTSDEQPDEGVTVKKTRTRKTPQKRTTTKDMPHKMSFTNTSDASTSADTTGTHITCDFIKRGTLGQSVVNTPTSNTIETDKHNENEAEKSSNYDAIRSTLKSTSIGDTTSQSLPQVTQSVILGPSTTPAVRRGRGRPPKKNTHNIQPRPQIKNEVPLPGINCPEYSQSVNNIHTGIYSPNYVNTGTYRNAKFEPIQSGLNQSLNCNQWSNGNTLGSSRITKSKPLVITRGNSDSTNNVLGQFSVLKNVCAPRHTSVSTFDMRSSNGNTSTTGNTTVTTTTATTTIANGSSCTNLPTSIQYLPNSYHQQNLNQQDVNANIERKYGVHGNNQQYDNHTQYLPSNDSNPIITSETKCNNSNSSMIANTSKRLSTGNLGSNLLVIPPVIQNPISKSTTNITTNIGSAARFSLSGSTFANIEKVSALPLAATPEQVAPYFSKPEVSSIITPQNDSHNNVFVSPLPTTPIIKEVNARNTTTTTTFDTINSDWHSHHLPISISVQEKQKQQVHQSCNNTTITDVNNVSSISDTRKIPDTRCEYFVTSNTPKYHEQTCDIKTVVSESKDNNTDDRMLVNSKGSDLQLSQIVDSGDCANSSSQDKIKDEGDQETTGYEKNPDTIFDGFGGFGSSNNPDITIGNDSGDESTSNIFNRIGEINPRDIFAMCDDNDNIGIGY